MSRWIAFPRSEGSVSTQAHADLPDGTYEREIGREGFYGPASHVYHKHPPTSWIAIEGPIRPRAFDTQELRKSSSCPWEATPLLRNPHVSMRWWRLEGSMQALARNADGDELLFVHRGSGEVFCDYGRLAIREGDYLLLPRGTLWRVECREPIEALLIEATGGSHRLPDRGLLGEHALFDPGVLATPALDEAFRAQQDEREWRVRVKARGRLSTIVYPFNPLDAVGWKGTLAPVRLNWREIRPVVSARYHLPPSAHSTFVADRFVVCTFCPRPLESDPGVLRVPFFHSNDDYDEVIFYHRGRFTSRQGIGAGAISVHPAGCTHGPHPEALAAALRRERDETDEVAVMVDARDPLEIDEGAAAFEVAGYAASWSPR
jgi:homogentisate 1,2-dioxygenase